MIKNKVYISGLNMTGKSFLVNLLNGHSSIASYPFHKFGFSLEHKKFKDYLNKNITRHLFEKKHFEFNEKKKINVELYKDKNVYKINISELILFLIKNNGSIPFLFETHFSKKFPVFAGDNYFEFIDINFDFNLFINSIEKNINLYEKKVFELEDLDIIIFNSFLSATNQYNSNLLQYKYYCQATSNDLNEINLILENYKYSKLIYIKRNLISSSYSVAKRLLSKYSNVKSKNNYKKIMFNYASKRKVAENYFLDCINKYLVKNKLLIINFEDIFSKREEVMNSICNFLDIKFENKMMVPHTLDYKIDNPYFLQNSMNDDPNELFSDKDLHKMNNIMNSKTKLLYYKYLYKVLIKVNLIK